jgi:hypothetical protein
MRSFGGAGMRSFGGAGMRSFGGAGMRSFAGSRAFTGTRAFASVGRFNRTMAFRHDHFGRFHHRHFRNAFPVFVTGVGAWGYDGYYGDSCWAWVPTAYGWQWAWVCGDYNH